MHDSQRVALTTGIKVHHAAYGRGTCIGEPAPGKRGLVIMVRWYELRFGTTSHPLHSLRLTEGF